MRAVVEKHLESRLAKFIINTLVFAFLVLWGVESFAPLSPERIEDIVIAKNVINGFFLIELLLRVYAYRGQFLRKMLPNSSALKKRLRTDASR